MKQYSSRVVSVLLMVAVFFATPVVWSQDNAAVDVSGKWLFQVQTGAGTGTPTITFKQDSEKLTGHYAGQLGEADLTGTIKGQAIQFRFTVNVQGYTLECIYNGTIETKDSLKGTLSLGELGEGTFTAKKQ